MNLNPPSPGLFALMCLGVLAFNVLLGLLVWLAIWSSGAPHALARDLKRALDADEAPPARTTTHDSEPTP